MPARYGQGDGAGHLRYFIAAEAGSLERAAEHRLHMPPILGKFLSKFDDLSAQVQGKMRRAAEPAALS
jgi:hypothetical protein